MRTIKVKWIIRQALCLVCFPLLVAGNMLAQQPLPPEQVSAQSLSPQQLDTLVAPVALYPDALLSQVLVASTYPLEIVEAGQWLHENRSLQGPQLVDAARQQNWDPSIQALVVFPDVINRLNADIRWTTDLGNAFLSQQTDVMNAVQRMRAQAMAAGKLQSNPQETVTTERQGDQSAIVIQPVNPEVVYVPYYNPQYIWGPPLYGYYPAWGYPGFGFGIGFGHGIYIGAFFGGLGWGGWGWAPNWYHCSIYQNHYFFNHYGYGGHGYQYSGTWAHDPGHRMGVRYPNNTLAQHYGGVSRMSGGSWAGRVGGQSYASRQFNSAPRTSAAQAGGWNRFGQTGSTNNSAQGSYRSNPAYNGSSAYRTSPSSSGNISGNRTVASNRFNQSFGTSSGSSTSPAYNGSYNGNRNVSNYRSNPSFGGSSAFRTSPLSSGNYSGNRTVPSNRFSPSYGTNNGNHTSQSFAGGFGGNHSASNYRSSPSFGGGVGHQSSGNHSGGGANHSGGGSRGGHNR